MFSHSAFPESRDWLLSSLRPPGLRSRSDWLMSESELPLISPRCMGAVPAGGNPTELQCCHVFWPHSIQQPLSVGWFCASLFNLWKWKMSGAGNISSTSLLLALSLSKHTLPNSVVKNTSKDDTQNKNSQPSQLVCLSAFPPSFFRSFLFPSKNNFDD